MRNTNFKLEILKQEDVNEAAGLIKTVIKENPYYNSRAKQEYTSWYTPQQLLRHMKKKDLIMTVAKSNGKIIGFGSVWRSMGGVGWADWTMVHKKYRREGIGTALWKFKINIAKKLGIHKIMADSLVINKEGNKFAKAHGLRKIAILRKHWFGQDYCLWQQILGKPTKVDKNFHWIKIED